MLFIQSNLNPRFFLPIIFWPQNFSDPNIFWTLNFLVPTPTKPIYQTKPTKPSLPIFISKLLTIWSCFQYWVIAKDRDLQFIILSKIVKSSNHHSGKGKDFFSEMLNNLYAILHSQENSKDRR